MHYGKLFIVLTMTLVAAPGCGTKPPYAASSGLKLTDEEARRKPVLDPAEQSAAIEAMRMAGPGHRPVRLATGTGGVRWSDVAIAVSYACDDIEAAVVETLTNDDRTEHRFRIRTVEDWPGEIVVRRVDPPQVYAAQAWIGRFPGERADRSDALLRAIDTRMRAFGRKRQYPAE